MAKRSLQAKKVLITGASSGIGRELTLQLCKCGSQVLATARRSERLLALQDQCKVLGSELFILPGDLTLHEHRVALIEKAQACLGGLDILINNAGAGAIGPFQDATGDRLRTVMEIDFFAPVELTRLCLPMLEAGNRPAILNIGSVLSHRAVPNKSEYCASKFAMRGWAESLRVELFQKNIEVLMLSPSTTSSEFFDALVETNPDQNSRSVGSMSPEQVAKQAISVLVRSKREMILSWGGKALVWAGRFFPRTTDRILGRFQ